MFYVVGGRGMKGSWPFEEAERLLRRVKGGDGDVVFETGYGPSGSPHIGTFGEVVRTQMVRRAFEELTGGGRGTRLVCFSDDMDGLRKVAEDEEGYEELGRHIGKPLSDVPDPGGEAESYGGRNSGRLRRFLDDFGLDYEFVSATERYRSGAFDDLLRRVLERCDEVASIVSPELGEERRRTYAPFLPVSERTGRIQQARILEKDVEGARIAYEDVETGERVETSVLGGACKLQWRADWAMRWIALGVDYETSGKDLRDSVRLSGRICRALGGVPPEGFTYELFLDAEGGKISKTKGNGLEVETWLRYASRESLSYFMYVSPKRAKRLHFDVIPRAVDDYLRDLRRYELLDEEERKKSAVWHIHGGLPPRAPEGLGYMGLLNMAAACGLPTKEVLWGYVERYGGMSEGESGILDEMVEGALRYFEDKVEPSLRFRAAVGKERAALEGLARGLEGLGEEAKEEELRGLGYEAGREAGYEDLKEWFSALYEVLLGSSTGPRFGSFAKMYGVGATALLIREALERK